MPWFPQHETEKGKRQEHQPRGESSTPSGCGYVLCMWSGALFLSKELFCVSGWDKQTARVLLERDGGARAICRARRPRRPLGVLALCEPARKT